MTKILVDKLVLEQALEALEQCGLDDSMRNYGKEAAAITALRAALAEPRPVQEPLDPDIAKIVNDNLWNLYVEEPEESVQETVDEREHIGYIEREEGYYKLYAPPKGSMVTQAFILCKYCNGYIYSCSGPKLDAICFHCYNKDPELR